MSNLIVPKREILVATPGLEVLGKTVGVFRLKFYKRYDPLRALRGEVPGELVADTGPLHNLVVTTGKNLILQQLFNTSPLAPMNSMGVGTDVTAVSAGQTKLNPSVAGSVYLQAFDTVPPAVPAGVPPSLSCAMTIPTGSGNFAIGEAGIFNGLFNGGPSGLFNRVLVSPVQTKTSAMTLLITFTVTQN